MQQRVGNRFWASNGNRVIAQGADPVGTPYAAPEEAGVAIEGNGVWGRIEGAHNSIEPRFSTSSTEYDQNIFKLQAGLDGMLAEIESGKLIGGVTVHYAHGKTKTKSVHGDGEISTDGYGFGGTLTWYGENGFYLDGQAQLTWYRSDLNSTLANSTLVDGNDGFGYALSIEGGKRIAIDQAWSLTPQAQLFYSSVDFDDFADTFGSQVSLDRGDSLQGRLGLTLDHESSWQNANGKLDRAHVYGIANLYYEFLEGTKVDVAGTSFASRNDRLWGGLGIGGSYNWNDDKYSIYGEGLVNTSLNNFGDSYSLKGQAGFELSGNSLKARHVNDGAGLMKIIQGGDVDFRRS
ncbi:autotransporter outer membrane beta-barrel domain-containing protein [Ochrobactrum anthropi ATCC 49188]|nr:autotransporter outer membrane beta-barrel domain-containing protein [Brucella anthropi ATCC 49188]